MKRMAIIAAAVSMAASSAALGCDQADAEARWAKAEEGGVILGVGMVNDVPSAFVDERTWRVSDLNVRTGIAETFECLIAGPGKSLAKAHILNKGGRVLAVWDGIDDSLEIK